jgi:hypothetical protein
MRIKSSGIFSSLVLVLPCLLIITAITGCSAPKSAGRKGRTPTYVKKITSNWWCMQKWSSCLSAKIENTIVDYLEKKDIMQLRPTNILMSVTNMIA